MKYWRVILSAASIDSDPPHVNHAFVRPVGRVRHEVARERFHRLIGKKTRVRERKAIDLRLDRVAHARIAVPEARHRSAAGAVEVATAGRVDEVDPVAADRDRQVTIEIAAVERVRHPMLPMTLNVR